MYQKWKCFNNRFVLLLVFKYRDPQLQGNLQINEHGECGGEEYYKVQRGKKVGVIMMFRNLIMNSIAWHDIHICISPIQMV